MSERAGLSQAMTLPVKRCKQKLLMKLLALLMGVAIACVLAELLVVLLFGEQAKFPRHVVEAQWGLRFNQPGARYRQKSSDITVYCRINRQGMRADRDYSYTKPEGVKRIISLGDSQTFGYEVSLRDCFSTVLEKQLTADGLKVQVLNTGVSGFSTAEECLYLERELMKYAPDLVVVAFFPNDLVDNQRTALFKLDGDELIEWHERYVPAGWMGNLLNANWFFNLLSERSNAFVFVKEKATLVVKRGIVQRNMENLRLLEAKTRLAESQDKPLRKQKTVQRIDVERRLAAAIFERMYRMLRAKNIPLLILSVPSQSSSANGELREMFPLDDFSVDRPGVSFISGKKLLAPHQGKELLYHERSHWHWTPFSNELAGNALARLIIDQNLLR